jgi:hypothetical protein
MVHRLLVPMEPPIGMDRCKFAFILIKLRCATLIPGPTLVADLADPDLVSDSIWDRLINLPEAAIESPCALRFHEATRPVIVLGGSAVEPAEDVAVGLVPTQWCAVAGGGEEFGAAKTSATQVPRFSPDTSPP